MTADEAALTWLKRGLEIIDQYKRGSSASLWYESSIAADGASALLENRWDELSESNRMGLQQMVDSMADVKRRSLDAAQGSPLADASEEFYSEVRRRFLAGAQGLKEAATIGGIGAAVAALVVLAVIVVLK